MELGFLPNNLGKLLGLWQDGKNSRAFLLFENGGFEEWETVRRESLRVFETKIVFEVNKVTNLN